MEKLTSKQAAEKFVKRIPELSGIESLNDFKAKIEEIMLDIGWGNQAFGYNHEQWYIWLRDRTSTSGDGCFINLFNSKVYEYNATGNQSLPVSEFGTSVS